MQTPNVPRIYDASGNVYFRHDFLQMKVQRWVPARKELVVQAIEKKLITEEEACTQFALTVEELREWMVSYRDDGRSGMRTVKGFAERFKKRNAKQE